MGYGTITAYALMSLEPRGTLFVNPGMEVGTYMISFVSTYLLTSQISLVITDVVGKDPIVYANYVYSR